jgi:hypothetical protein
MGLRCLPEPSSAAVPISAALNSSPGAEFHGIANFAGAEFSGQAGFNGARFNGDAKFNEARFNGDAKFNEAQFSGLAQFARAQFSGDTRFWRTQFKRAGTFGPVFAASRLVFDRTTFEQDILIEVVGSALICTASRFAEAATLWLRYTHLSTTLD